MSPGRLSPGGRPGNPFKTSLTSQAKFKEKGNVEDVLPPLIDAPAPDRSKIVVARQFIFQHELESAGLGDEKNVSGRLAGISMIEGVRRALRMPIKTYGTACVFYHRYRYHVATSDDKAIKYDYRDVALACLWLASKAEETPKKSKEILCAARNLTLPVEDHLTSDDEMFEHQSKMMINMERNLLEIVAFDFRVRNPEQLLAGLCHQVGVEEATALAALAICLDVYRTPAVLKQTRQTLASACLELAMRFLDQDVSAVVEDALYQKLGTTRAEVGETIRDLIDLYMNHQPQTVAGPRYNLNDFMRVSISITTEMRGKSLPRYAYYQEPTKPSTTSPTTSPHTDSKSTPTIHNTPRTPGPLNSRSTKEGNTNGNHSAEYVDIGDPKSPPPEYMLHAALQDMSTVSASPTSPTSPTEPPNPDDPSQISSVVRFVLDASRAHDEKLTIAPYYDIVEEEIVEERDVWIPRPSATSQRFNKERATGTTSSRTLGSSGTRIHGGFLSRATGTSTQDSVQNQRRTYTPPPESGSRGRGSHHYRRNNTTPPPRGRTPPTRQGYRREERSPPPAGRGSYARRGDRDSRRDLDDRRAGYRKEERRGEDGERRREYY